MHTSRIKQPSIVKDFQAQSSKQFFSQQKQAKNSKQTKHHQGFAQMISIFKQLLNTSRQKCQKNDEDEQQYISELEPRDRIINIMLPQGELTQESLEKFISKLCKIVWSRTFHYYSTQQLSYQNSKIYSSQQILRNIVRLSQKYRLTPKHFEIINTHLQQKLLEYEMAKYPITQSQEVNRNVNNSVREIDNTDQPLNDYLFNSSVTFKFRQNGEYNDLIMRLINQVVKKVDNKIGVKTVYQKFQEKMERLFESVLDEDWVKQPEQQKILQQEYESKENLEFLHHKYSISQQNFKKQLLKIKQKQKQKYRLKVQEYTSYKIGRKLPQSTHVFTENQILSHNLKIQSPQVLRILTKWCEQLQRKFTTPNYFEHYIETLKLQDGKFLVLVLNEVKEGLDQLMAEEHRNIQAEINDLAKNNNFMQSQLLFHQLKKAKQNGIQKYQGIAAKYSIDIVNNLHSYTLAYLNRLIHGLLTVAIKFTKLPIVTHFQLPSNINLITFQINDLVRCRCASGQSQIIKIYNQILKLCDSQKLKMIKVTNRLKRGTHDAVMTVKYRQVICQIQLSVTNKPHKFAQYSNMFNHYLYELKRSVFGPLTELCNIWKCLDGRFNVYRNMGQRNMLESIPKIEHNCQTINEYETYFKPFICNNCQNHYYHNNYIKHHFKCKRCNFWVCARCQLQLSDCKSMINSAYKQDQIISRCNRIKSKGNSFIPDYGICIFIQSQSTKVEPFRKCVNQNQSSIIGVKNKNLYQIYDVSTDQQKMSFKENYLIFELSEAFGKKHIKIDDQKIRQFFITEKIKAIYEKNKEKICLNYSNIKNDHFINLCKLGSAAQKQSIKKLEIISNKLEKVSEIANNFKNIKFLQLGKNSISNFQEIQKLQKLENLCVNQNKVKEFPVQICHLWNLKQLSFCQNQISSLPNELNMLHKLKVLKLSSNKIQVFPKCIFQLFYLNELHLKNNLIKEVPSNISSLNELQVLDLQTNAIETIHSDFAKLVSLQNLNLSHNLLPEFPVSITSIKSLQRCNMHHNKISEVPASINQFVNLIYLNLSYNQIKNFPSISSIQRLGELNLQSNLIEDLLQFENSPSSIKVLNLSQNNIKKLPPFYNFINLQEVYLNNNHLELLPQGLGKLQKIQILHAQHNEINRISDFKLQSLKYFNLSQNKICSFMNMDLICAQQIDLSFNLLASFSYNLLPSLKRVNLSNNLLQCLDLSNYPKLKYVFANMNRLQGLPAIQQKNHIKILSLQHNSIKQLRINLPNFHNLLQLNLAYNQISSISKEIELLKSLKDRCLDLSFNPIEKIQNIDFILKKCSALTVEQIKPMISLSRSVSAKSASLKQVSEHCLKTSKSITIERI